MKVLDDLYVLKERIYYLSYPVKIYYIADPQDEPVDYVEKVCIPDTRLPCLAENSKCV